MPERISEEDVRHVALLSRLDLSDEEIHRFSEQLSNVVDYMSKLNELDVQGVEPMAHAMDVTNVLREDAEQAGMPVEDALRNSPDHDDTFFKVVKVLGDGSGA